MNQIKTVYVDVVGGCVQYVHLPEGVQVIVRDFDDEDGQKVDFGGDRYSEQIWSNNG